jgi:hypothetical protein
MVQRAQEARPYLRYRLADLTAEDGLSLRRVLDFVGLPTTCDPLTALRETPRESNRRSRDYSVCWQSLPNGALKDRVAQMALEYGFSVHELEQA